MGGTTPFPPPHFKTGMAPDMLPQMQASSKRAEAQRLKKEAEKAEVEAREEEAKLLQGEPRAEPAVPRRQVRLHVKELLARVGVPVRRAQVQRHLQLNFNKFLVL